MAEPVPAPTPLARIENLDLLQTDLGAYILKETGIDISAHNPPERPTFSAADLELDPLSVLSHGFSNTLNTNILEGKSTHLFPAVVALPFKNGPDGIQACKAVAPILHGAGENPFRSVDEFERAEMMSHFPTFSFTDGLTANSSPIVPGSIILVSFDNPHNYWTSGVIEKVVKGRPDVLPEYADFITGARALFEDFALFASGALSFLGGGGPIGAVAGDPGTCTWSSGAKARETTWQSTVPAYSKWNGTKMRNGLLEETGMIVADSVSGAKLVPPAMEDFKRLAAAYAKKFPGKTLKGSGYRTYASQVNVRMGRVTPGNPCGSGEVNAAGTFIGMAATPGQSNHGWGAAVDLNRTDWEHGNTKNKKKAGSSKHFQWINKFSKDFNFVFGVKNEHWHIDWMPFTKQVTGWPRMRQTAQTPWTSEGVNDDSIALV